MSKKQITLELNITPTVADAQIKASAEKIKDALSRVKLDKSNLNVFKELSEWLDVIDAKVSELKKIDAVQFDKLYGVASGDKLNKALRSAIEPYLSVPENIGKALAEASQHLDNMRSKIGSTTKEDLQELKASANAIREIYKSMGKEVPAELNFSKKQKVTEESLAALDNALKNLSITWDEVIQKTREFDSSTGGKASNAVKKIANDIAQGNSELQEQIDQLEAEKKRYQEVIDAINGKKIKIKTTKKDDVAQVKELVEQFLQAKVAVQQYEIAKNTSGNSYKNALAEEYRLAVLLKNTMDDVSARGSKDAVSYVLEQSTASYDQAIKTIERFGQFGDEFKKQIISMYTALSSGIDEKIFNLKQPEPPRQTIKSYEELLSIVDKLSAFSIDLVNFDSKEVQALVDKLKGLYATKDQFSQVGDIIKQIFDGAISSTEALDKFKNIFGIDIPNAIQTAEEKFYSFGEKVRTNFTGELDAGRYLSSMETLRNELQTLYEQGRITEGQFNEVQQTFDEKVKKYVDDFVNKNNILKELNDLNRDASKTNDKEALEKVVQKRREILTLAEQNGTLLKEQLAEEKAITDEIEKRIGTQKTGWKQGFDSAGYKYGIEGFGTEGENEKYKSLIQIIQEIRQAVQDKTAAFEEERITVDNVVGQEITSLERLKNYLELIQSIATNIFSSSKPDILFHSGNLDHYANTGARSETLALSSSQLTSGYGAYGTGIYAVSNPNAYMQNQEVWAGGNNKIYAIDASKYNMYIAKTSEQAEQIYRFLESLEKFVLASSGFNGLGDQAKEISIDTLYSDMQTAFKGINLSKERLQKFADDMKQFISKFKFDEYGDPVGLDPITYNSDSVSTRFMRLLGYQGISAKGTKNDNTAVGSVFYDLDQSNPYIKSFDTIEQAIEYYNQSLKQTNGAQDIVNNSVSQWKSGLEDIKRAIESINSLSQSSISTIQTISNKLAEMVSNAQTLKSSLNNIIINSSDTATETKIVRSTESGQNINNSINMNNLQNAGSVNTESGGYALETTLGQTNSILGEIRSSVDAIGKNVPKTIAPTQEANVRIADTRQYEQIRDITLNAIGDRGTESKITGMKALADGLVQVNGYIKTAEGNYENFVVKVNAANEAIGLAFSENQKLTQQMQAQAAAQKAFSNNLNLISDEFVAYKNSINQSDQITAKFSSQIQQMENRLANISNSSELDIWKADWDKLTSSITAAKQEQEKLVLEAQKRKDNGILNSIDKSAREIYNSLKINPSKTEEGSELDLIRNKYLEISNAIDDYKNKREALTQAEINGLKQAEEELQKMARAYAQAQQKQAEAAKNTYGANQVKNISNRYIQLSGIASSDEFAGSASVQVAMANMEAAYNRLIAKQKEFGNTAPTESQKRQFAQLTDQYNQAYKALDNIIKSSRKLAEKSVGSPYEIISGTNMGDKSVRMQELQNAVNLFSNGAAQIKGFNTECTQLTYTIKNADGTFTEMNAVLDQTGTKIYNVAGQTKKATSLFGEALQAIKNKTKQLLTYAISMGGIYRVFRVMRQGLTYIKEIDAALTELKKVTDETDATYQKFLNTAAKTGAEIGATVSDFVNAVADFARLGYSISEATELAKAASVYKNVGD